MRLDRLGRTAILSLDGGSLGVREAVALRDALRGLADDDTLRVVVLESSGANFCTGPDDDLVAARLTVDPAAALASLRVPIVVALQGQVRSVGLEVALAGDLRIAAPDVRLAMPDVLAGRLPAWGGTQRLPRITGRPFATTMLLRGTEVSAPDATRAGLLNEVVSDPQARARVIASELDELGPLSVTYAKEAILHGSEMPMRDGMALEADLNSLLQVSEDRREGLAAFFDKRSPRFNGR